MPSDSPPHGTLVIKDASVSFEGRPVLRVDGLTVTEPRRIAVLGVSGSGKSTFAALIGGFLAPSAVVRGRCERHGQIAVVAQDAAGALNPLVPVLKQLALTAGSGQRAAELLESVGLGPHLHDRFPLQLSGGQRQRAALAFALGTRPSFIIADEVTSALDPVATADVVSSLRVATEGTGATLFFITHDYGAAAALCDSAVLMVAVAEGGFRAHVCTDEEWARLRSLFGAEVAEAHAAGAAS